jgi:RNA polymerase sigma-70 factor (ECF subfamily)
MEEPGPDQLQRALAAGDPHAFEVLYDRFAGRLHRAALGMLGRTEDAEDALQEVFASVVRSRKSLAEVEDLSAYLYVALRRAVGRLARRRRRQPANSNEAVATATGPLDDSIRTETRDQRLDRALECLPTKQREVIAMKIDGELTFARIGQVLGISPNTAASRYRYALEKLRTLLKE